MGEGLRKQMTRGVLCSNIMNRLREGGEGVEGYIYICKGEGGQDIIHRPHPNCSLLMYIDRNMNKHYTIPFHAGF